MLFAVKFAANICSILNGEVSTRQIAAGIALGVWIGLVPVGLLPTVLFFFALIVNVNLPMLGAATAIMKLLGFAIDPIASRLGLTLLTSGGLTPLWTKLYNMPLVPYSRFNNTIVMGSLVLGLVLFVPVYLGSRIGVDAYRSTFRERMKNSKLMKAYKASTFYKYYETFRSMRIGQ